MCPAGLAHHTPSGAPVAAAAGNAAATRSSGGVTPFSIRTIGCAAVRRAVDVEDGYETLRDVAKKVSDKPRERGLATESADGVSIPLLGREPAQVVVRPELIAPVHAPVTLAWSELMSLARYGASSPQLLDELARHGDAAQLGVGCGKRAAEVG